LNIGELNRWVLLRGQNLEVPGEKLQHDILWHFSPHKICWNKGGTQGTTPATTPRSKNSTPSHTPKAGGGRPTLSGAKSFGAALSMQGSDTDVGGVANVGTAAARKRSMISSFSSPSHGTSTVPRKKLNYSNLKNAPAAILHQPQ
jgi:hypothetical protein